MGLDYFTGTNSVLRSLIKTVQQIWLSYSISEPQEAQEPVGRLLGCSYARILQMGTAWVGALLDSVPGTGMTLALSGWDDLGHLVGADCLPTEIASVWDGGENPHRGPDSRGRLKASLSSTLSNSSEHILQAWPCGRDEHGDAHCCLSHQRW